MKQAGVESGNRDPLEAIEDEHFGMVDTFDATSPNEVSVFLTSD